MRTFQLLALILALLLLAACAGEEADSPADGDTPDGDVDNEQGNNPGYGAAGQPCWPGGRCDDGLECILDICAKPSTDGDVPDGDRPDGDRDAVDGDGDGDTADGDLPDGDGGDVDRDPDLDWDWDTDSGDGDVDEGEVEEEAPEPREENCSDGIDDDGDGKTDCEDIDCDDRFEPDNSADNAASIPPVADYDNLVLRPLDDDWYVLAVCNGASLNVVASFDDPSGAIQLDLYTEQQALLASSSQPTQAVELTYDFDYIGEALLKVSTDSDLACFDYGLNLNVDTSTCLQNEICDNGEDDDGDDKIDCDDLDCNDGLEPNDSLETAGALNCTGGVCRNLVVSSGNADYYAVSLDPGEVATFTLDTDDGVLMALYDADGNVLAQSSDLDGDQVIVWSAAGSTVDGDSESESDVEGEAFNCVLHVYVTVNDACFLYDLSVLGESPTAE